MKQKMLACILCSLVLLYCLPVNALAATSRGDWTYTLLEDGTAQIVQYTGSAKEIEMNWQLDGHLITQIGEGAFSENSFLRSIKLPIGVTVIRREAFRNCAALEDIQLPSRLETIEDGAFLGCTALGWIEIPDSVAEIGEACFEASTILGGSDSSMAKGYAAAMQLMYSPSVSQAAPEKSIRQDYQYSLQNGGLVITSYIGKDSEVHIPAQIDGYPVLAIGDNAFSSRYEVESVYLPEGLTTLHKTAFRYCPYLTYVELPSSLKTIDEYAFYKCEALQEITIPEGVTTLGNRAFEGCSQLRRVTLPASLTRIYNYTFFECHNGLTICAPYGSAAHIFAENHGYKYIQTN